MKLVDSWCLKKRLEERQQLVPPFLVAHSVVVGGQQRTLSSFLAEVVPAAGLSGLSLMGEELQSVRMSLPPLERHPKISGSDSSNRTGHVDAYLKEADFPVVEEVGQPRGGVSHIWDDLSRSERVALSWSTEASIVQLVILALKDMLYECGLSGLLEIVPEAGTFELRPDLWILRVGGMPVGVVEVKKPGDRVLDDERVLGELFDYMKHLPNFYGTRQVASSLRIENGACVGSTMMTQGL